jgi:hypothetical protein
LLPARPEASGLRFGDLLEALPERCLPKQHSENSSHRFSDHWLRLPLMVTPSRQKHQVLGVVRDQSWSRRLGHIRLI